MARGWESKDVEAQVETQVREKKVPTDSQGRPQKTPEQLKRELDRKDLELSRTRIVNDLETATNPHFRKSLEAALAHLDKKISDLS